MDTGCSISIINDKSLLVNVKKIRPITVNGIAGAREINMAGDLMLLVVDNEGVNRTIVVNNVLFDPDSPVNLLSSDQLHRAGIATHIETKDEDCCIVLNTGGEPIVFPLRCEKRIFSLYTVDAEEYDSIKPDEMVNVMGLFSGNISLEELMHHHMNHVNDDKTVEQSHRVDGIPRILRRLKMFKGPCNCCQDAKSKRNDYPPSTETWADGPDRWNFDMFDMGENFKTIHGHRYCTMVVIHKSRFAMIFLHSDRNASTIRKILTKAFAKAGSRPKILRSDGAGEYEDQELNDWLDVLGIHHQYSAPDSQYQNAIAEKFLDTLGNGIRALLLQSNLSIEFWGLAALYIVESYNVLPHSSINNKIPYEEHTGRRANVSMFRAFGCRATVFRGKTHVQHHKISPRVEPGIFVGLGLSAGTKAWLVYSPRLNTIFTSCDVQFDELFFPLRTHD